MAKKKDALSVAVSTLHKSKIARTIAKKIMKGIPVRQKFHGGVICCDMVEHSWAWVHGACYENFDRTLQDALLEESRNKALFVDVGCNIGAMTLSVLLRNPEIPALALDPNPRALALFKQSLVENGCEHRVTLIEAAVGPSEGVCNFDLTGSVTGHVSDMGTQVPMLSLSELLKGTLQQRKALVKIDIEGFETECLRDIINIPHRELITLAIELHPNGFNGIGNPIACTEMLREAGASLFGLDGSEQKSIDDSLFTQVLAKWS